MASKHDRADDLLHFGLWVEMTVLMEFLSADERGQLLSALGVAAPEYQRVSEKYLDMLRLNADPTRTKLFESARSQAAAGGRDEAIARFNRFLDGLHTS